ncbi:hypothetical protein SUGI_0124970 [Cryptomeria japonica]|nr:hypothetical protein SUGI_0124970 [Cryptomeria japonica]
MTPLLTCPLEEKEATSGAVTDFPFPVNPDGFMAAVGLSVLFMYALIFLPTTKLTLEGRADYNCRLFLAPLCTSHD